MLKKVKESMKPEMLFPEMEDLFATLKEFKLMKCNSEFELFFQMKSKVTELKSEVADLKSRIEELKSIIQQKGEIMNPEILPDAVDTAEENEEVAPIVESQEPAPKKRKKNVK
jgi:hypothetical protein